MVKKKKRLEKKSKFQLKTTKKLQKALLAREKTNLVY